jgi:DNA polymerase (family 10)
MENPYFTILAHPTGRLINARDAYEIDIEQVLRAAKAHHCFLEINAQPDRLDLTEMHARLAKKMGVKLAISTDAHSVANLDFMRHGVDQARRGWIEAADVVNCCTWTEMKRFLARA